MEVRKQVSKYAGIQVCKYARLMYVSMKTCRYASMQVCKYARMQECNKKWKLSCHLLTTKSFCHFVKHALNPKTSFTKFVQLGMAFENV